MTKFEEYKELFNEYEVANQKEAVYSGGWAEHILYTTPKNNQLRLFIEGNVGLYNDILHEEGDRAYFMYWVRGYNEWGVPYSEEKNIHTLFICFI